METIREMHSDDDFTISNKLIFDNRLSPTARLMMIAILSKPDKWKLSTAEIGHEIGISHGTTSSATKQLIQCGYIERSKPAGSNNHNRYSYKIVENPDRF